MAGPSAKPKPDETEAQVPEAGVVDRARVEMEARLAWLRPLAAEAQEIESVLSRMAADNGGVAVSDGDGKGPAAKSETSTEQGRGRPRGSGQRKTQFLAIVQESPGLKVSEIAKRMGIKQPNYVYRVSNEAVKDGLVRKEDDGKLYPVAN